MEAPSSRLNDEVKLVNVDHVQQRHNWDCGLACVGMVLYPRQRSELLGDLKRIAVEEGFIDSTWTIDLAYLLKRFNVPHVYRTITIGIDPSFKAEDFYGRILHKDHDRIIERFEKAASLGIKVEKGRVSLGEILDHLDHRGPVIVLTNAALLYCTNCGHNEVRHRARRFLPFRAGFEGHYVVVVGYTRRRNRVYYRNPALRDRICVMSFRSFEEARTAHGTDEDVLFIYFKNEPEDSSQKTSEEAGS